MFSLPSSYFVICVPSRRAGRSPSSYRGSRCEGLNCGACAAARAGRRKHPACHPVRWKPVSCSRAWLAAAQRTTRHDRAAPLHAGIPRKGRHMGSNARERPRVNAGQQCGDTPQGAACAHTPPPPVGPRCVEMPVGASYPPASGHAFSPRAVIAHAAASVDPRGMFAATRRAPARPPTAPSTPRRPARTPGHRSPTLRTPRTRSRRRRRRTPAARGSPGTRPRR